MSNNTRPLGHARDQAVCNNRNYFLYLLDLIDLDTREDVDRDYEIVSILHSMLFRWSIRMDENRAMDGEGLRDKYAYEMYLNYSILGSATVLEVLIAISLRFADALYDHDMENGPASDKFWELLYNLGLTRDDSGEYISPWSDIGVIDIVNRWMDRNYGKDGVGGIFPLKHPKKNQTKLEIWYQMHEYILEQYYVE